MLQRRNNQPEAVPFYCDECGVEVNPGRVCPNCKRVLCRQHFFGNGITDKQSTLCIQCIQKEKDLDNEKAQQA